MHGLMKQAASLALAGMVGFSTNAMAGKSDDTLVVGTKFELPFSDPYFEATRIGIVVSRHVWDNLLYRDPDDYTYKPALATSYKWVDNMTLDMTLREGVKFHNGEPFDADDVVHTLNFVSNPDNNVKVQRNVNWIASAEKLGPFAVRIHLKKPFPAALDFLAGSVPILPNEYYSKVGSKGMNENPVGTGPYMVEEIEAGKKIVFKRNPDYYAGSPKGMPAIGKLVLHTIPDDNTRIAELMSGGINWLWHISPDQGEFLKENPELAVTSKATMRIGYLAMDVLGRAGDHPLKDIRVRKAVAHAIDRAAIVKNLTGGAAEVVHAACYPTQFGCTEDVTTYDFSPEKAKALLAEAGYADGFSVTLDAYRDRSMAEAMIDDLKDIGIKVTMNYGKYTSTRDKLRAGESILTFLTWGSYSINDVSAITSHFFKGGPDDVAKDEEVKNWLETADTSVDPVVRKQNYSLALKKISEQVYWLPLWSTPVVYAYDKNLNFKPTPDEIPRFFLAKWK